MEGNQERKKILGVDYGEVRTGIAISDDEEFLANGIGTFRATGMREIVRIISREAEERNVRLIVLGNPINLNGSPSERSERVMVMAYMLRESTAIPVELFDERCTTRQAQRIMNETNTRGKKRKNTIDTLAAQIILQNYLDAKRSIASQEEETL